MSARKPRPKKTEYKRKASSVTSRMTVFEDRPLELEVHSTLLGYPIRFEINDELRDFLKSL